ncbi:dihydrofolate reductase family protein [Streptomyces sp. V4-01]|uniref:Dihydrofolate reductase family protein n=1 Tax=Actinacidiphila polyblastidii TaxID=3110430 RepID=A0ABU7P8Y4_9ACTN|nr:dihydrofolate reductase family protein [Streptomyces sp. V4-01]
MTRTHYYTATSLDGFIATADDSLDWLLSQQVDPEGPFGYQEFIAGIGALVMGATTYDWVLRHHVAKGEAWPYDIPAWVMTHRDPETFPPVPGADVRFASGDVRPVHAALTEAAAGRDIWVVGGGDLAAAFAQAGLLDDLTVSVAPVTLGAGRPLFARPFDLRLVSADRNGAFLCARYEVLTPRP